MYESPIMLMTQEITQKIIEERENYIHSQIVEQYGIFVDKEELIKALQYDRQQYEKGYTDAILSSVIPTSRWILVTEKLPKEHTCGDGFIEPSEYVLVQMKSGYMKVSRYWGSREGYKDCPWIDLSYPTTDEVIAWMPLPELYKEGED